jgi:membrane associated rhomboid family serine protease
MFRRSGGAILCPRCGRLTHPEATECLVCGLKRPGRWQWATGLGRLVRTGSFTGLVTVACIALYLLSLVIDPASALRPRGPFDIFSPGGRALDWLGMTGAYAWQQGRWWTLLTAIYLHGSVLHILFNVLWIRQLGPAVEELYGPGRLVMIFTVAGVAGFALSSVASGYPTVGASGAIFGLLGAMVAYGQKRGGTFGKMVLREYGTWAVILFVFGLLPGTRIDNWAHAGGFIGGLAAGWLLSFSDRRREGAIERVAAAGLIGLTAFGFVLAFWTAFANG